MATLCKGNAARRSSAFPARTPEAERGTPGAFPEAGSAAGRSGREAAGEDAGVGGGGGRGGARRRGSGAQPRPLSPCAPPPAPALRHPGGSRVLGEALSPGRA